jgi:hypothetical protein
MTANRKTTTTTTTTTTKRFHDQIGSSGPPPQIKRCKQQQDLEAFSIMTAHGIDLRNCFNSSVADVTASAHGNYDFPDFVAAPQQVMHVPESQEAIPYQFFEFLGTGAGDANVSPPIAFATTSSVTDPAAHFTPAAMETLSAATVTGATPCSKAGTMSRPQPTTESLSHMDAHHHSAGIATQQARGGDNDPPSLLLDADQDPGHNSDGQGSATTAAEDSESSRRQADRAARNRESSRRAREKAKGRLKALEAEVLVLRDHCRRYKVQMDTLAQQAARGQCGMCGCVIPAPGVAGAASGHSHCGQQQQMYIQPPQDLGSSMGNVHRC